MKYTADPHDRLPPGVHAHFRPTKPPSFVGSLQWPSWPPARILLHHPERLCTLSLLDLLSLLFCRIDSVWQHDKICTSVFWNTLDFEAPTVLFDDLPREVELHPQSWR